MLKKATNASRPSSSLGHDGAGATWKNQDRRVEILEPEFPNNGGKLDASNELVSLVHSKEGSPLQPCLT